MKISKMTKTILAVLLISSLCGCTSLNGNNNTQPANTNSPAVVDDSSAANTVTDLSDLFTDRDLAQSADLTNATYYTVSNNTDITISSAGVYVLSGNAEQVTVIIEAGDEDKVQLVLDGLNLTNTDAPCIYVKSADKVFVTTTSTQNTLKVTSTFSADGDTNTDAVIFAKDDLVLNGTGTLTIESTDNGITSKDDLKITGGTYDITCENNALEAHDSIAIADGNFTIVSADDGLHAEDDDDDTVGYIYIADGSFNIKASDDAIHATTTLTIDGGEFTISCAEGLEATQVTVNGGTINISASDDGINAAAKSSALAIFVRFTGGNTTINMGQGDTDGVDSNGNLYISGGTISVNGQSAFDFDGQVSFTGGTVYVNGQQVTSISNQMMGGGMMPGGNPQGDNGFPGGNGEGMMPTQPGGGMGGHGGPHH